MTLLTEALDALRQLAGRVDEANDLHAVFTIKDSTAMTVARALLSRAEGESGDELDANARWLTDVIREVRKHGRFPLASHDMPRLREVRESMHQNAEQAERIAELEERYNAREGVAAAWHMVNDKNAQLQAEVERLKAESSRKSALINGIDKVLSVPAAEYVPAIQDVFDMIDRERNQASAALEAK